MSTANWRILSANSANGGYIPYPPGRNASFFEAANMELGGILWTVRSLALLRFGVQGSTSEISMDCFPQPLTSISRFSFGTSTILSLAEILEVVH